MPGKRKQKKARRLSPAQARIYRRGLARGKVLAAAALRRKRQAAARKAAETRKQRPKKPKPPERAVEFVGVDALVLYEAPDAEGVPILSGLSFAEWVDPSAWEVALELWVEGQVVAEGVVTIPAEWDNESAAKLIRREVRSWYEAQVSEHPAWRESPAATLIRLSLRRT